MGMNDFALLAAGALALSLLTRKPSTVGASGLSAPDYNDALQTDPNTWNDTSTRILNAPNAPFAVNIENQAIQAAQGLDLTSPVWQQPTQAIAGGISPNRVAAVQVGPNEYIGAGGVRIVYGGGSGPINQFGQAIPQEAGWTR